MRTFGLMVAGGVLAVAACDSILGNGAHELARSATGGANGAAAGSHSTGGGGGAGHGAAAAGTGGSAGGTRGQTDGGAEGGKSGSKDGGAQDGMTACTNACVQGQQICMGTGLATCAMGQDGCLAYGVPVACPSVRQTCTSSGGTGKCVCKTDSVCTSTVGVNDTCADGSTVAHCGQDPQGCFYEASSTKCSDQTCYQGACAGVCAPGQNRCSDDRTLQTCSSMGTWTSQTCPYACTGAANSAACGGSCVPQTVQCGGTGIQVCDSTGTLQLETSCSPCTPGGRGGVGATQYCAICNNVPTCVVAQNNNLAMSIDCVCP